MKGAGGLVSVLVVSYNGAAHLPGCLDALASQTLPRHRFEVVVVDNASADGSADLVRTRYPWCRLAASRQNLGFTGGNNLAAALAHGDRLALLNHDTVADPHWLEELLRAADANPGQIVASKLVFAHDPTLINSAGLTLLRDGRGADRGFRHADRGQYEAREPVFMGCGAAVLLDRPPRGEALLEPGYFLYYEDLDLGWRHRLDGGTVAYAPRSLVRHAHGAAAGDGSPLFWFCVERNRALTALRNADAFLAAYAALTLHAKVIQAAARWLIAALTGRHTPRSRPAVAKAVARAALSYWRHAPLALFDRQRVRQRAKPCG